MAERPSGARTVAIQSRAVTPRSREDPGSGTTVAMCHGEADELCVAACDLDAGRSYKSTVFNFGQHRQPQHYTLIVERKGAEVTV